MERMNTLPEISECFKKDAENTFMNFRQITEYYNKMGTGTRLCDHNLDEPKNVTIEQLEQLGKEIERNINIYHSLDKQTNLGLESSCLGLGLDFPTSNHQLPMIVRFQKEIAAIDNMIELKYDNNVAFTDRQISNTNFSDIGNKSDLMENTPIIYVKDAPISSLSYNINENKDVIYQTPKSMKGTEIINLSSCDPIKFNTISKIDVNGLNNTPQTPDVLAKSQIPKDNAFFGSKSLMTIKEDEMGEKSSFQGQQSYNSILGIESSRINGRATREINSNIIPNNEDREENLYFDMTLSKSRFVTIPQGSPSMYSQIDEAAETK